jgi:hypothetical protein
MAIPNNDKHKEYVRYAAHCLNLVTSTKDQDSRRINREMAAEWIKTRGRYFAAHETVKINRQRPALPVLQS